MKPSLTASIDFLIHQGLIWNWRLFRMSHLVVLNDLSRFVKLQALCLFHHRKARVKKKTPTFVLHTFKFLSKQTKWWQHFTSGSLNHELMSQRWTTSTRTHWSSCLGPMTIQELRKCDTKQLVVFRGAATGCELMMVNGAAARNPLAEPSLSCTQREANSAIHTFGLIMASLSRGPWPLSWIISLFFNAVFAVKPL